jgi:L-fucose dehydrogenase
MTAMDLNLRNKVIVIYGNACSNPLNLIRVLSDEGANVIITGTIKDIAKLKKVIEISDRNVILSGVKTDHPEDYENAVQTIIREFGHIDGLVNLPDMNGNAGSGNTEMFLESLQKNLVQYYLMTHFVLPHLKKSTGSIVNISFNSSETEKANSAVYAASKGGINALTREWAVELLKYSIRVNAIIAEKYVSEMSNAVAFLLSNKSSHTTGQLIRFVG